MSDLPFEIDDEEKTPTEPETLASNVLIVDDEPVVRDVFKRLLAREQDMMVSVAEDAEQGLELIKRQRFELLVTDKNLPGMGGIELIAEARAVRPMIEAVMITGYASSESLLSAFAAGATDYLVKPFDDLKVVRAKVRAALQRRLDRGRLQISSKDIARQAAAMLGQGRDAPEAAWRKLDAKFAEYERAIRDGGAGTVAVVGSERVVATLSQAGIASQRAHPTAPQVLSADVVVIETGPGFDWHPLAERLMPLPPDVVLVAGPEADLSDLLEAISLRVDLVGFGGHAPARLLPDRVRANMMRRSVERAQRELAAALEEFKASIRHRTDPGAPVAAPALDAPLSARTTPAPPPAPVRSVVTPVLPMPAMVAPPAPAAARVTPAQPLPATMAPPPAPIPLVDSPRTPGPAAPSHKPAPEGAAVRRPTGSFPPATPPPPAPAAGPMRRPTGSFQSPLAAPGGDAGLVRKPTGAFAQASPPGAAPAATPRTVTPPEGAPRKPPAPLPLVSAPTPTPVTAEGLAATPPPPAPMPLRRPSGSFPAASPNPPPGTSTPRPSGPRPQPQGVPLGAGTPRPSGPHPQPGAAPAPPPAGAMRRPSGSFPAATPSPPPKPLQLTNPTSVPPDALPAEWQVPTPARAPAPAQRPAPAPMLSSEPGTEPAVQTMSVAAAEKLLLQREAEREARAAKGRAEAEAAAPAKPKPPQGSEP